jgi:hypothetical protein
MFLPPKDRVWNRAALDDGGPNALAGDIALASLLALHGMVMNGGIEHALETLEPMKYEAGVAGYEYFGLSKVAALLRRAQRAGSLELERLDEEYGTLIPSDQTIDLFFEQRFQSAPWAFAPLAE